MKQPETIHRVHIKPIGVVIGLLFLIVSLIIPPLETFHRIAQALIAEQHVAVAADELARSMQTVAALMILMVAWWITETLPLSITALLPLIILPGLHVFGFVRGEITQLDLSHVVVNYASPVVMLFFGGFLLAASMRKWHLDRRLTLWVLTRGTLAESSYATLFAIMALTAFMSMWISNTATCAMMLPLSLGILAYVGAKPGESNYGKALMLGIAWAASVGGVGTLIGTPPNGIAVGVLNSAFANDPNFQRITFLDWMKFGIPYVVLFLPIVWFLLIKVFPPEVRSFEGGKERLQRDLQSLGVMTSGEKGSIAVFLFAVILWIGLPFRELLLPEFIIKNIQWLDEYTTGLFAGMLLFIVPSGVNEQKTLLHWRDLRYVEWGTLAIVGGGIALSDAMFKTGFASWTATSFVSLLGSPSTLVMMFGIVFLIDFLTEVATNSAIISMMAPVVISIAKATGENPVALTIAAAIASSMAFMLPVATPPNALVYGTGYIRVKDMVKAGIFLEIIGWLFTIGILTLFGWLIFGVFEL